MKEYIFCFPCHCSSTGKEPYQHRPVEAFRVSQAVHCTEKDDYLIKLEDHKTNESFGTAKMLLTDEEYGWLMDIIHKNQVASFTSLRSAVATFARDRHGEDSQERRLMARLMCHDTATSDKFYAMDLTMDQARKGRLLFEQAQEETTRSRTRRTRPQSEEGDEGERREMTRRRMRVGPEEEGEHPKGDQEPGCIDQEKVQGPVIPHGRKPPQTLQPLQSQAQSGGDT
ncbi:Replicase polyprotein 1ab [Dissostichus eleginoides]|uniref:Replicase polyprotein 1ab n=1 Tax=Dissostichus eleginoides TaxID=100907 RepID=A0AAD9BKZ0_DISEL|nr:Replicase polyprotein 1ab [Dissostichus eleginoides]